MEVTSVRIMPRLQFRLLAPLDEGRVRGKIVRVYEIDLRAVLHNMEVVV